MKNLLIVILSLFLISCEDEIVTIIEKEPCSINENEYVDPNLWIINQSWYVDEIGYSYNENVDGNHITFGKTYNGGLIDNDEFFCIDEKLQIVKHILFKEFSVKNENGNYKASQTFYCENVDKDVYWFISKTGQTTFKIEDNINVFYIVVENNNLKFSFLKESIYYQMIYKKREN